MFMVINLHSLTFEFSCDFLRSEKLSAEMIRYVPDPIFLVMSQALSLYL
jgi:hypothetical protein